MATACIVFSDVESEDAEVAMKVIFGDGFDRNSPAHAAIRRLLDHVDSMGIEIREPVESEAPMATPDPLLLGADGYTLIQ